MKASSEFFKCMRFLKQCCHNYLEPYMKCIPSHAKVILAIPLEDVEFFTKFYERKDYGSAAIHPILHIDLVAHKYGLPLENTLGKREYIFSRGILSSKKTLTFYCDDNDCRVYTGDQGDERVWQKSVESYLSKLDWLYFNPMTNKFLFSEKAKNVVEKQIRLHANN